MIRTWRLDDQRQSFILGSSDNRLPEIVYWGAKLPASENLEALVKASLIDVTGGMLDSVPALSICPNSEDAFIGQAGLIARSRDHEILAPRFRFTNDIHSENSLTLHFFCEETSLTYEADFSIDPETQMLTTKARLSSDEPILVEWFAAPVFPASQAADHMLDFSGRWCREFQIEETKWCAGTRLRESRTGRTGHENFPGLIVPERGTQNSFGNACAFHLAWSGGHRMIAEELQDGRRQIQFGAAFGSETAAKTTFETPALFATFSDVGLNGCATSFQKHLRDRVVTWPKPSTPRPVHYNCWEAVYFDHNLPTLTEIADRAAKLGAERFVLDDGWFGVRDLDDRSLGDWQIDPRKYPEGLGPLIAHVQSLGMGFGLWFEPEMVNPDSDLYRQHPEWILGTLDQPLGRQQLVLDMARSDVKTYLFECISSLLEQYDIEYIKWDHNRILPIVDADQIRGTYDLLAQLRHRHPDVEIESCASGGGRIDAGILDHTQRVWLSDSNDALERLHIQHNAALFLPSVITGSHVGPRVCHTSGRNLDIHFRAWVAASRHLGFEMDPRELNELEEDILKDVTAWWKTNRNWMAKADILRLDAHDPAVIAEMQLCDSKDRFVLFAGKAATSRQISPRPLRLTGLDADAFYELTFKNKNEIHPLSRGKNALKDRPVTLSGQYLMTHGITLPWGFPERMWVLEGRKL